MSSTRHRASCRSQDGLDRPGSTCCRDRPRVMLSVHLSVHTSTLTTEPRLYGAGRRVPTPPGAAATFLQEHCAASPSSAPAARLRVCRRVLSEPTHPSLGTGRLCSSISPGTCSPCPPVITKLRGLTLRPCLIRRRWGGVGSTVGSRGAARRLGAAPSTEALSVSPGVSAAGGRHRELLPWLGSLPGRLREADRRALVRCVGLAVPQDDKAWGPTAHRPRGVWALQKRGHQDPLSQRSRSGQARKGPSGCRGAGKQWDCLQQQQSEGWRVGIAPHPAPNLLSRDPQPPRPHQGPRTHSVPPLQG